ncbi:MAG TPA: amidohydrolase family protein, partial [Tepidisphaeraceae bacterium]|nr:amidohydrolase family protein [Tepidisphaeraceae bacterium]
MQTRTDDPTEQQMKNGRKPEIPTPFGLLATAFFTFASLATPQSAIAADYPDLILLHGKIVTVDPHFSIAQAIAVKDGRIVSTGADEPIAATRGLHTVVYDLAGKTVLPGLIDSHVHPRAAMTEFDHPIPEMESIEDVLEYVSARAKALGEGQWIEVSQVFITRL